MMNKGQISAGIVWTVVILLVAVAFGGLIFGRVQDVAERQSEGTGTTTTTATANSALSDNTATAPDDWDNSTEPAVSDYITNAWNTSGYLTVTRTDNGDNIENGIWHQSVTLAGVGDGITAAIASYEYRIIDNENAASIVVRVQLCNGTDNTTLFVDNLTATESTSWTAVENDVSNIISTTGTYTLYLRAEISTINNYGEGASAIVGFDDASISVNTYGQSIAENIIADVGETGSEIFPLILLLVLIGVFVAIIAILKVLG